MNNKENINNFRTWAKIDLDALNNNYRILKSKASGNAKIMAVIKADAYGHGAPAVAKSLEEVGADFFSVSNIDEAVQLISSGVKGDILILGYTAERDIDEIVRRDIVQTVFSYETAELLSDSAVRAGKKARIHIKIDTGMNRIGLKHTDMHTSDVIELIEKMVSLPNISAEGIFTHFASAGDPRSTFTALQFDLFMNIVNRLETRGIYFSCRHVCNSAAFINFPHMHLDMVRCGILLYGLYPAKFMPDIGLKPCMELHTSVAQVHSVYSGETVSYDRTYKAGSEISAATLPIGYADGFSRLFSNSSGVIIRGKKVPVIGRVCMDQTIVDVTGTGAQPGDTVTVIGENGGQYITVDDLADMMETINYEVVCLIGKRVPRIFYKNGEISGVLNYITQHL